MKSKFTPNDCNLFCSGNSYKITIALKFQIRIILTVLLFYNFSAISNAQTIKTGVKLTPSTPGNVVGTCFVTLPDSVGWTHVAIELSDKIKDSILFYHEYTFDQVSGLPAGLSWERQGVNVTLGVGTLSKKLAWIGKVKLKNNSGVWSLPTEFIFQ